MADVLNPASCRAHRTPYRTAAPGRADHARHNTWLSDDSGRSHRVQTKTRRIYSLRVLAGSFSQSPVFVVTGLGYPNWDWRLAHLIVEPSEACFVACGSNLPQESYIVLRTQFY
jgi:hypothetical protein